MSIFIKNQDKINKIKWIPCNYCNNKTQHKILDSYNYSEEVENGMIQIWTDYYLLKCMGCNSITLLTESSDSENSDFDPYTGEEYYVRTVNIYPKRLEGRKQLSNYYLLPSNVSRIYLETFDAICNSMKILSGIGIRVIVEAVCQEKRIINGNLQNKIDELHNKGIITEEGASILHNLRFMGNVSAHEIKEHTIEELNVGFDVIENLLSTVYIIPKKAEIFKKNKKKNNSISL